MSYQQFFTTSTAVGKNNRLIFYGPSTCNWTVPEGTTEVHVHVWGGGGSGCFANPTGPGGGAGGGGGGYARAEYAVTSGDTLAITVGGNGGTSSVTIPTQAPISPVSATGGGNGSSPGAVVGAGGSGAVSLGPQHPTYYCFTADGGNGSGCAIGFLSGGGGAAGSPLGRGGDGGNMCMFPTTPSICPASGGGIGNSPGSNYITLVSCISSGAFCVLNRIGGGPLQQNISQGYNPTLPSAQYTSIADSGAVGYQAMHYMRLNWSSPTSGSLFGSSVSSDSTSMGNEWFYVEDIAGNGAVSSSSPVGNYSLNAGAGGGGSSGNDRSDITMGGFLGGGAGGADITCSPTFGKGGCAGGSGAPAYNKGQTNPGTPGVVIIYW